MLTFHGYLWIPRRARCPPSPHAIHFCILNKYRGPLSIGGASPPKPPLPVGLRPPAPPELGIAPKSYIFGWQKLPLQGNGKAYAGLLRYKGVEICWNMFKFRWYWWDGLRYGLQSSKKLEISKSDEQNIEQNESSQNGLPYSGKCSHALWGYF